MKKKHSSQSRLFNLRLLLGWAAACSMISGTLLGIFPSESSTKPSLQTLTFAERVAYQRAIEEVYWRHRIWPKENPNPKPALDAVMSQGQLEKKVEAYLLNSRAVEDYYKEPLSAGQLQGEMDRMGRDTRQPEVLRELFEALGNDPFLIAECLARPVLAEQMITGLSVRHTEIGLLKPNIAAAATANYTLPAISDQPSECVDDSWTRTSRTNAPTARSYHTAVWTGSEMIVWGGQNNSGHLLNNGGRYIPSTDSWTPTSTTDAPTRREGHTAVWTGNEMIVWSGDELSGNNTGGRYNPSTDSWTATSTTNAPTGRGAHAAAWTGSEMIVWGGFGSVGQGFAYLDTGGRYNPDTDSWTATSTTNAPEARGGHTAVWTGSEMIVWGGNAGLFDIFNTGGRYNPDADSWTATSTTNPPEARAFHTAVWTGGEMIVWGGNDFSMSFNTGGKYNPNTDNWTATSTTNAPNGRWGHTAVWTGSEMIVWGGDGPNSEDTGGRYNPGTDSWTPTTTTNAPTARINHTAVWTGSEMIVWGGQNDTGGSVSVFGVTRSVNTGGRYCAQSGAATPTPTPTATATATATATLPPSPTPTPSACTVNISDPDCDSVINTQPVDFFVNLSDPTDPSSVQPTDFTVNGIPADSYMTPNFFQIVFHFNTSPVVQGLNVMHIPACAFICSIGCTSEFTCTFTYQPSTPTPTPRPSSTPRVAPTPRPRPSPPPRP